MSKAKELMDIADDNFVKLYVYEVMEGRFFITCYVNQYINAKTCVNKNELVLQSYDDVIDAIQDFRDNPECRY